MEGWRGCFRGVLTWPGECIVLFGLRFISEDVVALVGGEEGAEAAERLFALTGFGVATPSDPRAGFVVVDIDLESWAFPPLGESKTLPGAVTLSILPPCTPCPAPAVLPASNIAKSSLPTLGGAFTPTKPPVIVAPPVPFVNGASGDETSASQALCIHPSLFAFVTPSTMDMSDV